MSLDASPTLLALVAVERPLPVDLLASVDLGADEDLPSVLSRLELDGLIEWADDGTVAATETAVATHRLPRSQWAVLRGAVGRAARSSALPVEAVAEWLLDGCRVVPDPTVVPWLVQRANQALRAGDLPRSAAILAPVVAAIERGQPVDPHDRLRVFLRYGFVLRWLGRRAESRQLAQRAVDLARESGDPMDLAAAALAWREESIAVSDDPASVALIDEALEVVPGDETSTRSRLLAARADGLLFRDLAAAGEAADDALRLGRESGDAETFVRAAYSYRLVRWHPSRQEELLQLGSEMVALAPRSIDFAEFGAMTRLQVFLELGDWPHLDGELTAMGRRLEQAPRPMEVLWWTVLRAARAQSRGEWDAAAALTADAHRIASGPEYGAAFQLLLGQQVLAAWHRGEDLRPLASDDSLPAGPMRASWEACLLGWTCDRLQPDQVEHDLDRLLADGLASVRQDLTFGPVTSSLAMAAAEIRSVRHAALLAEAIEPFAEQWASTGGAVVNGPFALHLGRLLGVLGRAEEATALFARAERSARAGGCLPWEARTALAQAEVADDLAARQQWARRAAELADAVGMAAIAGRARSLAGVRDLPVGLTEREAEALRLLADGATNAQIAAAMYVSVKTVERHLLNAYRKAGVRNRAEAAAFTLRELSH